MTGPAAGSIRTLLRDCVLLLLLAAAPALLAAWLHPKRPEWTWSKPQATEVDLREIAGWPPPVLWVDAREAPAYEEQHIPGAVPLNETEWERLLPGFLGAWRPGTKVVVYCNTQECNASAEVVRRLKRELNLADLYILKGGWATWQQTPR